MQTFLPDQSFKTSASILDRQRLGKQRVETMQVLGILLRKLKDPEDTAAGWKNHPLKRMWFGYEWALLHYGLAMCEEWSDVRGYQDTCAVKMLQMMNEAVKGGYLQEVVKYPPWLGREDFHASHRYRLLQKDWGYYSKFRWSENETITGLETYVWPA